MCIIIDDDHASLVFAVPAGPDFRPLWRWLLQGDGVIVYGGDLAKRLLRMKLPARSLQSLAQSGRAQLVPPEVVEQQAKVVDESGLQRSNKEDRHILGLALASGARILCSGDQDLHADFKDREIIPTPRGRIYQTAGHDAVLHHDSTCIYRLEE